MTRPITQIIVTVFFVILYAAFLIETGALALEFGTEGLAVRMATLFAHNFLFFPVVGFLVLIAFWRPTVLIVDALLWNRVRFGRVRLGVILAVSVTISLALSAAFGGSNSRSLFEISPAALIADQGVADEDPTQRRASVQEILVKMKINSMSEGGLGDYKSNCDPEWVRHAEDAREPTLCFPTGTTISVSECCAARTRFREFVNTLEAEAPSNLGAIHRAVMPFKMLFLMFLLFMGIQLVNLREQLTKLYGKAVQEVSFPIAIGGAFMLLWPLMNAAYLDTFSLLTDDGSSNLYRVNAPLFALGFGIWAMLLVFFHLRTYPSQMELALKATGALIAALGVLQYEQIIAYLSRTLGIGGGLVAIIVFTVCIAALVATVMLGKRPEFLDPTGDPDAGKEHKPND